MAMWHHSNSKCPTNDRSGNWMAPLKLQVCKIMNTRVSWYSHWVFKCLWNILWLPSHQVAGKPISFYDDGKKANILLDISFRNLYFKFHADVFCDLNLSTLSGPTYLTHWPLWDAAVISIKSVIFKFVMPDNSLGTFCEIALTWTSQNLSNCN